MLLCIPPLILSAIIIPAIASDVLTFTDTDFIESIQALKTVLVEFYAPWCGHCKRFAPEYEKAATALKKSNPPIPLAKVDCTQAGKDTCEKFSINGYPSLKIFRGGEYSHDYTGIREANGIVTYMLTQAGPSAKTLESVADLQTFLSKQEVGVVGFFETADGKLRRTFEKVADKLRDSVRFAHSSSADVLKKYKRKNKVVLYRPAQMKNKFEDNEITYKGDKTNRSQMEHFISHNYHGLVGHRTSENSGTFPKPLVIAYFKVDYTKNIKGTNYWRNRILKIAKAHRGNVTFAISSKDEFSHEMNELGLPYRNDDKPVVSGRNAKSEKFVMADEFTPLALNKFVVDFLAGNLTPHMKSEPEPEVNDGPVKVVVAKSIDKLVTKSENDVLIEFYAPWCGHCKKLAPIFDELGSLMKLEDVDVVKMDATANDVPDYFRVSGFPTLFWVPKNGKTNPVRYEGGRELDDFVKFVAKHATVELKEYDRSGKKKGKKGEL